MKIRIPLFVCLPIALSACAGGAGCGPSGPVGMVNPASAYCVQLGGKLLIKDTVDGQAGMCTLPDGTEIEEWALYRRDHPSQDRSAQ